MGIWAQHGASLSPMPSGIKECLLLCVSECYIRCMSSIHDVVYEKTPPSFLSCFLYSIISLHVSNPKNISSIYFFHSFTLWSIFSCIHSLISFLSCEVKNLSFPHETLTPLGIPNHGTIELTNSPFFTNTDCASSAHARFTNLGMPGSWHIDIKRYRAAELSRFTWHRQIFWSKWKGGYYLMAYLDDQ